MGIHTYKYAYTNCHTQTYIQSHTYIHIQFYIYAHTYEPCLSNFFLTYARVRETFIHHMCACIAGTFKPQPRFFVLERGLLTSYEAAEYPGSPRGVNQVNDELFLVGYSVTTTEKDCITISVMNRPDARSLTLRVDVSKSQVRFDSWFEALCAHSEYAR